nr:basic proline-rich protein-like [Anas platyrhynchos]
MDQPGNDTVKSTLSTISTSHTLPAHGNTGSSAADYVTPPPSLPPLLPSPPRSAPPPPGSITVVDRPIGGRAHPVHRRHLLGGDYKRRRAATGRDRRRRPRHVSWAPPPAPRSVRAEPVPTRPHPTGPSAPPAAAASMHPALYTRASKIREIAAAVGFISKFLRTKGLMNERQLQTFSQSLQELLAEGQVA